jgi:hypothetical protein
VLGETKEEAEQQARTSAPGMRVVRSRRISLAGLPPLRTPGLLENPWVVVVEHEDPAEEAKLRQDEDPEREVERSVREMYLNLATDPDALVTGVEEGFDCPACECASKSSSRLRVVAAPARVHQILAVLELRSAGIGFVTGPGLRRVSRGSSVCAPRSGCSGGTHPPRASSALSCNATAFCRATSAARTARAFSSRWKIPVPLILASSSATASSSSSSVRASDASRSTSQLSPVGNDVRGGRSRQELDDRSRGVRAALPGPYF